MREMGKRKQGQVHGNKEKERGNRTREKKSEKRRWKEWETVEKGERKREQ